MKKIPKKQVEAMISDFFKNISSKNPKEIKKIKKLAMHNNVKLGNYKKLFCKKCFSPHLNSSIRIKNNKIKIECKKCKYISRIKIS